MKIFFMVLYILVIISSHIFAQANVTGEISYLSGSNSKGTQLNFSGSWSGDWYIELSGKNFIRRIDKKNTSSFSGKNFFFNDVPTNENLHIKFFAKEFDGFGDVYEFDFYIPQNQTKHTIDRLVYLMGENRWVPLNVLKNHY